MAKKLQKKITEESAKDLSNQDQELTLFDKLMRLTPDYSQAGQYTIMHLPKLPKGALPMKIEKVNPLSKGIEEKKD